MINTEADLKKEYDSLYRKEIIKDEDRAYAWLARLAKRYLKPRDLVLDVACGGGFFLSEIEHAKEGGNIGIDISEEALKIAKYNLKAPRAVSASAERLPFKGCLFDFISCLGSLEHFLSPETAVYEIKRVLRRNGRVMIMVPNLFWYKDIWSVLTRRVRLPRNQSNEIFKSLGEWECFLKDCGLKIIKTVKYNGISPSPLKQLIKNLLIPSVVSYHFIFICENESQTMKHYESVTA